MRIAEHASSQLLKQMIERKHVLILNWLFDITGRRTPLPPGFHSRLAEALVSGDPEQGGRAHARARALWIRRDLDAHRCARRLGMARAPAVAGTGRIQQITQRFLVKTPRRSQSLRRSAMPVAAGAVAAVSRS